MPDNKYLDYFDIDEKYFSCIDDAAIEAGAPWKNTYPHSTFMTLLTEMERALARQNGGKTLWIEGAYGTGKSQCTYALRRILEVPEEELRDYWDRYEPLKRNPDLFEKLMGHKKKGIVVAYRYASGGISSARDLFFAIQESVKAALVRQHVPYLGENTLKESIIAWLEDADHQLMFNSLLQNPDKEWRALFPQSTAEEVLNALRKNGEVKELVNKIFRLADKEGITALSIDSDRLIAWLTDVMDQNDLRIVLIWDEFSDYFKNNRESLSEFQKVAALVQSRPFYFIVVTHDSQKIYVADIDRSNQAKVSDRFVSVQISLPDNIAFQLIGHALKVKPSAKQARDVWADDLNNRVQDARSKVMAVAKIDDPTVIKGIMPLHPMAALLLKNIAAAFQSNQRSMFDFIKSSAANDAKAFQWFIENVGPFDDHPLLTVDMLWSFFYEKNREHLTAGIRAILDTFPQQQDLREDEKAVLKAILIMEAIDQRLDGQIDLIKPTAQNLSYVFEGIPDLEDPKADRIANGLKERGILVSTPISGGRFVYAAAVLAGDQVKIDHQKDMIRQTSTTAKLVAEGGLSDVLALKAALHLRFENERPIPCVTLADFTRTINGLREEPVNWKFQAVIAFARDEAEAVSLRNLLKEAAADPQYENIVFIDALSTPLGPEAFEQYLDYSAMAEYYNGGQTASSTEYTDKAKKVLSQDWKNRIANGPFIVYTHSYQEGEKFGNARDAASFLQTIVTNRFPYAFDFARGLTESQLRSLQLTKAAKSGIQQSTSGAVVGIEKIVLPTVWKNDRYWEKPETASLPISKIKVEVDRRIREAFDRDGQISIGEIYDFLEDTYGFAPCNLSLFLAGFLLKEYGGQPLRYSDSIGGHEPMTPDKLAEMLANYVGRNSKPNYRPTYIVKMTAEEKAFYKLTEKAWGIPADSCTAADQAAKAVIVQMRKLRLPVWCLEEVDTAGVYDIVQKYIELVQKEGREAHQKAVEIGGISAASPELTDRLSALLTIENCQQGMREYLRSFEDGQVLDLAASIGAQDHVLDDICSLFEVKYSCLWNKQTGEDEIRRLITHYRVVKESNVILGSFAHSLDEAYKEWRERLKFLGISWQALQAKYPSLSLFFETLVKICRQEDILPEQVIAFQADLTAHAAEIRELLNNDRRVFAEVYEVYLEDLSMDDIAVVKTTAGTGLFMLPKTECNIKVREAAEELRKNQLKSQLFGLWMDKTGTKNPCDWSSRYRTPILCMISAAEYEQARKAFDTLNRNGGTDSEIKAALAFLQSTTLFDVLADEKKRDAAFRRDIVGHRPAGRRNSNRRLSHRHGNPAALQLAGEGGFCRLKRQALSGRKGGQLLRRKAPRHQTGGQLPGRGLRRR